MKSCIQQGQSDCIESNPLPAPTPGRRIQVIMLDPSCVLDLVKDLKDRMLALTRCTPLPADVKLVDYRFIDGKLWLYLESPQWPAQPDGVPSKWHVPIMRDGEMVFTDRWVPKDSGQ